MATLSFNTTRMRTPSLPRLPRSSSFTKPIKTHLSSQTLSKRRRFVSRSLPESSLSIAKEETEVVEDDDPTSELSYLDPETDAESIKEWELDFCSRPILDSRGKKIWELVVCDASLSLQVTKYFPNNVINSITLKDAIVSITQDLGVPLPEKIRFFRSQMQTIITKACKELAIKEVPSKRCLSLFLWLQERYDTVYTRHPGFQKGSLPLLSLDNPFPMNLPENLFGEKWAFVQLPYSAVREEISDFDEKFVFGATLDLDLLGIDVDENTLIPGLSVASSRAKPLAAWMNGLEVCSIRLKQTVLKDA
ncbi:protein TAB2 homolog, chloroplastic isoform X2 [Brassica napus]|uniref:protein TAB2 homolog, chloroplastic isoform X2 n=1 Tax=Brassica napus TaxID=3708 RepID=UPI00207A7669|nr:protein TAB2 homolog, chloroplastic isoform X2 [Brassica napus]